MTTEATTKPDRRERVLDDIYVKVEVPAPEWLDNENALELNAEEIAQQIKRHVDVGRSAVRVTRKYEFVCSDCESRWTEDSHVYNGGCCGADEDHADDEERNHDQPQ